MPCFWHVCHGMLLWAIAISVICSLSLIQTAMRQLSALAMAVNMLVMKKISLALAKRMLLPPICQLKPATVSRYSSQPSHKSFTSRMFLVAGLACFLSGMFTRSTFHMCIWLSMHNMEGSNKLVLHALPGSLTAMLLAASAYVMSRNNLLTCVGCEQDNWSGDEADAEQASQPSQTHQPSADESRQPQLPSAYREPKRAWKKIQRTGHLAPAPGTADLTVEHNFSDEVSIDSLK